MRTPRCLDRLGARAALANNAQYSVVPAGRVPNLASRAPALNPRRLSGDWRQIHGRPLLLVAETFVDTARFEPPLEPKIRRILQTADVASVDTTLSQWVLGLADNDGPLGVDGIAQRFPAGPGRDRRPTRDPVRYPSLSRCSNPLELSGQVVTADALHTQRETARFLVEDKQAPTCGACRKTRLRAMKCSAP